jgi:hypothetical protein
MSLRILSLTFITLAGSSNGRCVSAITTLLLAGLRGDRERSARDARGGHDGVRGNRR